jgi:hypothetical protein
MLAAQAIESISESASDRARLHASGASFGFTFRYRRSTIARAN